MSRQNVEALKAVYASWQAGDFWTPEIFDADIEVVWEGVPDLGANRGLAALESGFRSWLAAWEECRMEADELIPVQDRVLVLVSARGRGKGSTVQVEAHWAHVWTFRDGKAVRLQGFVDPAEARKAVGLSE